MEGWLVGSRDREGTAVERSIGWGGNRGGAQSQACRVAAKWTVMLATGTGCCGPPVVLVCTSKGQAVNMKTQLVSPPSNQSLAFPTLLFLALRLSFSSFPHERSTSKVLRTLCSGGEATCLQERHGGAWQTERATREMDVEKKGGHQSERHIPDCCQRWQRITVLWAEQSTRVSHTRVSLAGSQHTRNVPSCAAIFTFLVVSLNNFAWIQQTVDNHTSLALMRCSWLCFQASPAFSSFIVSPECNCILGPGGTSAPSHRCIAIMPRVIQFKNKWIQVWFFPYIPFSIPFFRHVLFSWQGLAAT